MNLTNHFLIAMPSLQQTLFEKTVIYICEHNEDGAMGVIINQPIDVSIAEMFEKIEVEPSYLISQPSKLTAQVLNGGPVSEDRGFVLHSGHHNYTSSILITDQLALTTSLDVLSELGSSQGPQQFLVALGYAGWDAGQLEQELAENSWLTVEADPEIIFNTPLNQRWQHAISKMGFTAAQLSTDVGHA
ncbi:YqgE/AlgH family protein [Photobacterium damselae]|uniref:YqgE/AlgH family protein n=1 Tax=Photobacterium damselae TaxID=38293 RepID=UPI001EDEB75A|nr:YqgE/AlgH family protein [Photobacterium damselae]MCG3813771.1 YqgE/AlgH family protein [Photobacterium damselae]